MAWYCGPTLLEHLHSVEIASTAPSGHSAFRCNGSTGPNGEFRGYCGTVVSGTIAPGEEVLIAGSGRSARVKQIVTFEGALDRAQAGDAVTLTLESEIDIARGDLLADPDAPPEFVDQFAAHVIWLSETPARPRPLLSVEDRHAHRAGYGDSPQAPHRRRYAGASG